MLQVWTIFAKFDEIQLFSPPKNLSKFRQPLDALRGHLTKSQVQKKNFFMPNHFVEHLKDTVTVKFRKFSKQFQKLLSFSSEPFLDLASSHGGALLPVPSFLSLRRLIARKLAGVGDKLVEVRHPVSDGSSALCGCQRGAALDGTVQRRPSH